MTDWATLDRFSFGDGPLLADKLLALVLAGTKTATCWAAREGELTYVGKRMVACDGAGRPCAVLETVTLERRRFCDVDASFAWQEGESDRSLAAWQEDHRRYFERNGGFDPNMALWCETFRLVQSIPLSASGGE